MLAIYSYKKVLRVASVLGLILLGVETKVSAASATWNANPANGDWNQMINWAPVTVPNGPADVATFGVSNLSSVFVSASTEVDSLVFNAGASPYTVTASEMFTLNISGTGIINNSGIAQNFVAPIGGETGSGTFERIKFTNNAPAGSSTVFTTDGGAASGINGGAIVFYNNSSAANATFINYGSSDPGASGGSVRFANTSSAGNATLIAYGGVNGGQGARIDFGDDSSGGTARVEIYGNAVLDIGGYQHPFTGVTIGSLEGDGLVALFDTTLIIGSNNLSTTYSGSIPSGFPFGFSGGITKIGTGALTLTGNNAYQGKTTVNAGQLIVNGSLASATTVNGGTLGGSGTVGVVTINNGGTLSPGNSAGILKIVGNLTLKLGSTYLVDLNGTAVGTQYDQADVLGAVSLGDATLLLNVGFSIALGDQFTVIKNDGTDAVSGIFQGLPEGATFTSAGQAFMISYQSGDGNDVVLTSIAVPEPTTFVFLSVGGLLLYRLKRRW